MISMNLTKFSSDVNVCPLIIYSLETLIMDNLFSQIGNQLSGEVNGKISRFVRRRVYNEVHEQVINQIKNNMSLWIM